MQIVLVYLQLFQRNSLLKCVSQPRVKIANLHAICHVQHRTFTDFDTKMQNV